jgi:hypothetical protein
MTDILVLIIFVAILGIAAIRQAIMAESSTSKGVYWVLAASITVFLCKVLTEHNSASDYDSMQFELVDKIPFEWNKSHQSYFFHHGGEWKASEAYVDHFDSDMVTTNHEYDSCMVYKVSLPTIMWYFDNRWWVEEFEYRQSEDILLLSREKKKIEMK